MQDKQIASASFQRSCCVVGGLAEAPQSHEGKPPCVHVTAEVAHRVRSERKRDKARRFVANKGPRMVGAAAAIGMFIFNIVSSCA